MFDGYGKNNFSNSASDLNDMEVERLLTVSIRLKMHGNQQDLDCLSQGY